jgi:hypothetical protein
MLHTADKGTFSLVHYLISEAEDTGIRRNFIRAIKLTSQYEESKQNTYEMRILKRSDPPSWRQKQSAWS